MVVSLSATFHSAGPGNAGVADCGGVVAQAPAKARAAAVPRPRVILLKMDMK
jgi:hypothetical protein